MLAVEALTEAICNSRDHQGIDPEAATAMAMHVLNFFGFNDRIIDNVLEPEDRDAFYMLEDSGLLVTEREETTLYDGREWRIHYWLFRRDRIRELIADAALSTAASSGDADSVYTDIPDEVWSRVSSEF